jgi:hypothetical protein
MERDSFYVIARSTFGDLVLWGTNTGQSLKIAPAYGGIFPTYDEEQFKELGPDKELQLFFGSTSRSSYGLKGADGKSRSSSVLSQNSAHSTMTLCMASFRHWRWVGKLGWTDVRNSTRMCTWISCLRSRQCR